MKQAWIVAALALFLVPTVAAQNYQTVFSAHPQATDFGYDYVEQAFFEGGGGGDSIEEPCYVMYGQDGDFAYLGKALDGGDHYRVAFSIEAASEGATSGFAAAFSFVDAVPSATSKGDGDETAAFADSVKVKFREDDNNWRIHVTEVVSGDETTVGSVVTQSGTNTKHLYFLEVDAVEQVVRVLDASEIPLIEESTSHAGAIHSQWFVAWRYGNYFADARTCVDDDAPSTEIRDYTDDPPTVGDVVASPSVVEAGQSVSVQAPVTDDYGVDSVLLYYTINGGGANEATMSQSGTEYTGTIPGQSADTVVRFWVEATDDAGQVAESAEFTYTVASGEGIGQVQEPTGNGGANLDADTGRSLLYAFLIAVAGVGLGILILAVAKNKVLGTAVMVAGLLGGLAYGLYATVDWGQVPAYAYAAGALIVAAVALYAWRAKK